MPIDAEQLYYRSALATAANAIPGEHWKPRLKVDGIRLAEQAIAYGRDLALDKLHRIGQLVEIGPVDDPLDAIVTAVSRYSGRSLILVAWWDGRIRRSEWLDEFEVRQKGTST